MISGKLYNINYINTNNIIIIIIIIRSGQEDELSPGIQDFEASFLRLIDKLTDGIYI